MEVVAGIIIFLVVIYILIYFLGELIACSLLISGIIYVAVRIHKSHMKYKILWFYLWLVNAINLFVWLLVPITHIRLYQYESSWTDIPMKYVEYSQEYKVRSDNYVKHIAEKSLNVIGGWDKNQNFELYNRMASEDSAHLYLQFTYGMYPYQFLKYNTTDFLRTEKYKLTDKKSFEANGIYCNGRLCGVVMDCEGAFYFSEEEQKENVNEAKKILKNISKKYGPPHELQKDSMNLIAKWLFDSKHIILECAVYDKDNYSKEEVFRIYSYNPHRLCGQINHYVRQATKVRELEEKRKLEEQERIKEEQDRKRAEEAERKKQQEQAEREKANQLDREQNGF